MLEAIIKLFLNLFVLQGRIQLVMLGGIVSASNYSLYVPYHCPGTELPYSPPLRGDAAWFPEIVTRGAGQKEHRSFFRVLFSCQGSK